ncbi:hypothetical protein EAI89_06815 [Eubacterium sp. am_0171]|uniref:Phage gp6-like head-tail connector protein n=1 Tax=Faecalicatena contorta TaxID=39482 RepID=A0A174CNW0_9FIRM|nr:MULTISPECIES: hypothetical protein [Clostridia]MSC84358.1 hypothetical protein [Eubacterium sp. BIOML-A1]MSD05904.1 hypothetical protein [Eubacterium sp. BIOML-A2]RYT23274.1 hypothetical protein EAI89_06815 [Eubacterium sp. am_0171]CUO13435.1 Uncharacterised protein [[Eubacterium] contortum] [Faecalicatena contorta]
MINLIKKRCGISENVKIYDNDIEMYIKDCIQDMISSGVSKTIAESEEDAAVLTAITLYVSAYLGIDRTDTEKYLDLYRKKVFRLTLEGDKIVEQ